jgi:RND family efflux transporter MFP subunit
MRWNPFLGVWSLVSTAPICILAGLVAAGLICAHVSPVTAAEVSKLDPALRHGVQHTPHPPDTPDIPDIPDIPELPETVAPESAFGDSLRATTIRPYRSADMASEVSGMIETIHFQEGELIQKGQVVVEISTKRYTLLAEKAQEALKGLTLALENAEQNVRLLRELLSQDATTRQDLLKAETDRDVLQTRLKEAKKDFELAQLNLEWCRVKAPFTGYFGDKFKDQFEPVERLEKIFSIVDNGKVYALANVAEKLVPRFKKGTGAAFVDPSGKSHPGIVEKVGKLIDPKSKTRKVWVLIDNAKGFLDVGMTGTLIPESPGA